MGTLSTFAAKLWVLGGIAASLLWFAAGRQSLSNRRPDAAIGWQAIAVIIALMLCGWTMAERQWLGLGTAIVVVYFEVRAIRRPTLSAPRQ
jgi:hypothetical protein